MNRNQQGIKFCTPISINDENPCIVEFIRRMAANRGGAIPLIGGYPIGMPLAKPPEQNEVGKCNGIEINLSLFCERLKPCQKMPEYDG